MALLWVGQVMFISGVAVLLAYQQPFAEQSTPWQFGSRWESPGPCWLRWLSARRFISARAARMRQEVQVPRPISNKQTVAAGRGADEYAVASLNPTQAARERGDPSIPGEARGDQTQILESAPAAWGTRSL